MAFSINATLNLVGPNNVTQIVNNINQQLKGIQATVNLNINSQSISSVNSLNSALVGLNNTLRTTQALSAQVAAALNSFGRSVSNVSNISTLNNALNNTASSISSVTTHAREGANAVNSFGEQAGLAVRRFLAFSLAAGGIVALVTGIKQGIRASIDFETQLTRLRQVGDDTTSVIAGVSSEVRRLAVNFGVSSSDLVKAAVTIRQAGFSAEDTKKSLEGLATAALSPNFGNMEENVTGLVAAMRQFNLSAEQTNRIIGATNAVASEFAVEAKDIFDAVKRAGGVFSSLGGQFEEFISIFTSVRNQSQESAESIASGLRTIFGRLQRPETVDALKALQINLRYTAEEAIRLGNIRLTDNFVGPLEAVRRLSEGLRNLPTTDPRYANVVQQLGGDRQISKVLPLITQDETRERALFIAQTNQESATRGAALAQETLANKIKQTKEEFLRVFDVLTNDSAFQNFAKSLLTIAQGLAKVLEFLKPVLPLLITLGTIKIASSISSFLGDASRKFLTDHSPPGLRGLNSGGLVGYNRGGVVGGVGYSDTVPAALTSGEFVIRRPAAEAIGYDRLHRMNQGYADGGNVQKFAEGEQVYGLILSYEKSRDKISQGLLQLSLNEKAKGLFNQEILFPFNNFLDTAKQKKQLNIAESQTRSFKGVLFESWIQHFLERQGKNNILFPVDKEIGKEGIDFLPGKDFLGKDLLGKDEPLSSLHSIFDVPSDITKKQLSTVFGIEAKLSDPKLSDVKKQLANLFVEKFNKLSGSRERGTAELYPLIQQFIGDANHTQIESKLIPFVESLRDSSGRIPLSINLAKKLPEFLQRKADGGPLSSIFSLLTKAPRIIPSLVSTGLLAVTPNDNDILEFLARKQTSSQLASISESIDRKQRISRGQGSISREDTVPALLTPGEFVFSKEATQQLGSGNLHYMNRMGKAPQGFNRGGFVGLATGTNQPLTQQNAGQLLGGGFDFEITGLADFKKMQAALYDATKKLVDATLLTASAQEKSAIVTSEMVKYRQNAVQYEKNSASISSKERVVANADRFLQSGRGTAAQIQTAIEAREKNQLALLPLYTERKTLQPQLQGFYESSNQNNGVRLFGGRDLIAGGPDIAKPISRLESFLSRLDSKFGGGAKPPTADELQSSFYKTQALAFVLPYISLLSKSFVPSAETAVNGTSSQRAAFFVGSAAQGGLEGASQGGVVASQLGQSIASIAPNIAKNLPVIGTLIGGFVGLVSAISEASEAFKKAKIELGNLKIADLSKRILEDSKEGRPVNLGLLAEQRDIANEQLGLVATRNTLLRTGFILTPEARRDAGDVFARPDVPRFRNQDQIESRGAQYLYGRGLQISAADRERQAAALGAGEQNRLNQFIELYRQQVRQTGSTNINPLVRSQYGSLSNLAARTTENLGISTAQLFSLLSAVARREERTREANIAANQFANLSTNFKQVADAAKLATVGLEGLAKLPSLFEGITTGGQRQFNESVFTQLPGTEAYESSVNQVLSGLNSPRINQLRQQALNVNTVNEVLPEVLAQVANNARRPGASDTSINSQVLIGLQRRLGPNASDVNSPLGRLVIQAANLASRDEGRFTDPSGSITELVTRTQRELGSPVDAQLSAIGAERMRAINVILGLRQATLQAQLDSDRKAVDISKAQQEAINAAARIEESQRGLRTGAVSTIGAYNGQATLTAILGNNANLSVDEIGARASVLGRRITRINNEASTPENISNPEAQIRLGLELGTTTDQFNRLRIGLQEHINIRREENQAIQERLGYLRQERDERHGLAERLLTGSPEEAYRLNRGIEVGRSLSGGGDIRNFAQSDVQAFFEAARSAGNIQFGFGSLAEIRNRTLSAIPGVGGVGEEERGLTNRLQANNQEVVNINEILQRFGNIPQNISDTFTNSYNTFFVGLDQRIGVLLQGMNQVIEVVSTSRTPGGRFSGFSSAERETLERVQARVTAINEQRALAPGTIGPAQESLLDTLLDVLRRSRPGALVTPPPGLARGGPVYADLGGSIFRPRGTDTVPAMLTPGEFVINRNSAAVYRDLLERINSSNGSSSPSYSSGITQPTLPTRIILPPETIRPSRTETPTGYYTGGVVYAAQGGNIADLRQQLLLTPANQLARIQQLRDQISALERQGVDRDIDAVVNSGGFGNASLLGNLPFRLTPSITPSAIIERATRIAEGENFRNLSRSSLLSQLAATSEDENLSSGFRSQIQGQAEKQKALDERIKTLSLPTNEAQTRSTTISSIFGQAAQRGGAGNFLNPNVAARYSNDIQQRLGRGRQFARIRGFAEGGEVGATDTVPAMLSPGEFVFSKSAVDNIGVNQLQRVHHYAAGGPVGSASSAAGAATGGQDIIFDQFNKVLASATGSFDNLSGALSNFVQNSSNLVDALNSFPRNVSLEGRQTVEVILNGGEVLANIMPDIQTMIEKKTQQALRDTLSKSFPDINLGVENV